MSRVGFAGGRGWEGSTHPFVLFNPVLEHYEKLLHACIYILDPTPILEQIKYWSCHMAWFIFKGRPI